MSAKKDIFNIQQNKEKLVKHLSDEFDVNYNVSQIKIESFDDFYEQLFKPYENGKPIYYRGERKNSPSRKLLPTLLRTDTLISAYNDTPVININYEKLCDYYRANSRFMSVYKTIYSKKEEQNIYTMLAFAQHYMGVSPFIDFSKSLYVALSFAIKGREKIEDDIVVYTAYDIDSDDTSNDIEEVIGWIEKYNVSLLNKEYIEIPKNLKDANASRQSIAHLKGQKSKHNKFEEIIESVSPIAKLIDIPTNDLMKYQQGVFLLLNDFSLFDSIYLTKTVRQSFIINKYIISPSVAVELRDFVLEKAPQYRYECLLNISKAVRE